MNTDHIAGKLAVFALAMFGFGYVLVPIYDVLCDVTGLNGKTGEISAESANELIVDHERMVRVQFDTNVHGTLPWEFKAVDKELTVHPGEVAEALFVAVNTSSAQITGQAIPSLSPSLASLYFNKTECFCFTQQTLAAHERKEMVVRFVIDPELPKKISTVTLSYTFFIAPESKGVVSVSPASEPIAVKTKI